jgi:hypothetical protein
MIRCTRQISCLNHPFTSSISRTLSTSSSADIQSIDQTIKPVWKYSPGIFVKPDAKGYDHSSKLSTYRRLRRLVQRTSQGQAQMWYEERSSRWSDNHKHLEQVNPHGLYQYSPKWMQIVRAEYDRHRDVSDPLLAAQLHNDAMEYAQLLQSSIDHSVSESTKLLFSHLISFLPCTSSRSSTLVHAILSAKRAHEA